MQPQKKSRETDVWGRLKRRAESQHAPDPGLWSFAHHDPMALNTSRSAVSATCKALRRCSGTAQSVAQRLGQPARQLSTSAARNSEAFEMAADQQDRPRWSYTPERMKGPGFSINVVKDPSRTVWQNNEDPEKLDSVYNRLLGSKGDRMLPDEIKWLAITHKSFDQGRRGFNTRLAYFGAFHTAGARPEPVEYWAHRASITNAIFCRAVDRFFGNHTARHGHSCGS
jgi:large subunit ribosomal protein L15